MSDSDKKLLAEWLAALRSGEYTQTEGKLNRLETTDRRPIGYCCLGVLCDVLAKQGIGAWHSGGTFIVLSEAVGDLCACSGYLPNPVARKLNLRTTGGHFEITDKLVERFPKLIERYDKQQECSLVVLNDHGWTFSEIADIIDARPQGMFKD